MPRPFRNDRPFGHLRERSLARHHAGFAGFALSVLLLGSIAQGASPATSSDTSSDSKSNHAEKRWFKGNTHTHTFWSDGNDFPEMIVDWYHQRDYQFLVLSDHNVLSRGDRWMSITDVARRAGGDDAIEKYVKRFGKDWVQRKTRPHARTKRPMEHVRLRPLAEFRSKFEKPGQFLMIEGEEITGGFNRLPVHINAMNLQDAIWPAKGKSARDSIRLTLRRVLEQESKTGKPILAHLNHPNFGWGVTAEDMAHVLEQRYFEVYNGHPGIRHLGDKYHASVERMWDIANALRIGKLKAPPLMGVGTDDSHTYHGRKNVGPGRGWVMVHATDLSAKSLIHAMRAGDFYASSGVVLNSVTFHAPKTEQGGQHGMLEIQINPADGVTYTSVIHGTLDDADLTGEPVKTADGKPVRATLRYSHDVGKVLATIKSNPDETRNGNTVKYKLTGKELYVRATVTASRPHPSPSFKGQMQQAWTQPVGWRHRLAKP